jgi:TP901 family phage tail tape measure protein
MAIKGGDIVYGFAGDLSGLKSAMGGAMKHTKAVGAAMTVLGGTITAVLGKSVTEWASYGDEIAKAAKRTGLSTEAMSELKHAAEQSGAGLPSLENGLKRMAAVLDDARDGTGAAVLTLEKLGLTVQDFQGLTPEQTFMMLADSIRGVQDPLRQAALAQEVFGRGGMELLPLINEGSAGMAAYAEEARKLGIVLDEESAAKAEKFTDTMDELKKSFQGMMIAIGPFIADALIPMAQWLTEVVAGVVAWTQANPGLTQALTIAAGAVGVIMTALGPLLMVLPGIVTAFGMVSSAAPVVGAALVALTGPIGWVIAAVAALGGAVWYWWEDIVAATEWLWDKMKEIWSGIVDVISGAWETIRPIMETVGQFNPLIGGMMDMAGMMGFAAGGVTRSPFAMVGEHGPEMVSLPMGSRVHSAGETRNMLQGAGGVNVSVQFGDVSMKSDADIDAISRQLARGIQREFAGVGIGGF